MIRRVLIVVIAILFIQTKVSAQSEGIIFLHSDTSWSDAIAKAKEEGKLIFIDFYTQWCGPCYTMSQTVFTLSSVASFYNSTFVSLKIDAEKGEGVALAKKYGVKAFPTYAFVDPFTEEIVHKSTSRQEPEQFIQTGKDALIPSKRSFYLIEQYGKGNRDKELLIDYINYQNSIYATENVSSAFKELVDSGYPLTDAKVWELFVTTIKGVSPYLIGVSEQYPQFCKLFGKEAVDKKLFNETTYGDIQTISSLCNFEGKDFNISLIQINNAVRKENYTEAAQLIDSMITDPTVNQQLLIGRLKFIVRVYNPKEIPQEWFKKCVGYLRYIAYNQANRDDARIHQEYAAALEYLLSLPEPQHGKKEYNLRPDALKSKKK